MSLRLAPWLAATALLYAATPRAGAADVAAGFRNPPQEARPRVY
ncbi:MAG TPA: hypothetical protein PKJ41_19620 [Bryobacteraceae bacterium]|nr:hypothetical protein [Bryobacteraceae bacterium]HPT25101.1 hypothetical protein [Bryobacteraceae bacterium]